MIKCYARNWAKHTIPQIIVRSRTLCQPEKRKSTWCTPRVLQSDSCSCVINHATHRTHGTTTTSQMRMQKDSVDQPTAADQTRSMVQTRDADIMTIQRRKCGQRAVESEASMQTLDANIQRIRRLHCRCVRRTNDIDASTRC